MEFRQGQYRTLGAGDLRTACAACGPGSEAGALLSYGSATSDVIVEMGHAPTSPTYRTWATVELSGDEQISLGRSRRMRTTLPGAHPRSRTCPIASTVLTILIRTNPLRLTTPNWPYPGHCP